MTTSSDPGTPTPRDATVSLIKAGIDTGIRNTDRKCTRFAPDKILEHIDTSVLTDVHRDELFIDPFDHEANQEKLASRITEHQDYGTFLMTVGGDHSTSYPILRVLKQAYPDLRVLWLDAHLDLKEPRTDHGTPHDALVRRLCEEHGFDIDDFWFIGHRATDPDEETFLGQIQKTEPEEIESLASSLQNHKLPDNIPWAGEDPVYLSLDIDLVDGIAAPGTTFPVDGGPKPDQVQDLIAALFGYFGPTMVGADLVEVAPPLDDEHTTQKIGAEMLTTFLTHAKTQSTKTSPNDA